MLRDGFLKASGIDTTTGRRIDIPSLEWSELSLAEGRGNVDEVRRGLLGDGYRDVLIPSAPIRKYWRRVEKLRPLPPETIAPTGHGYMPLYCAAQWIATEGGRRDFDPEDIEKWRPVYRVLADAISTGAIRAVGMNKFETKPLPAYLLAGIRVDHPFQEMDFDLMLSSELVLRSYAYLDEEHWLKGFDDSLVDRRGNHWTRLMFEKSGVRALWPFDSPTPSRSGTPGCPTSAHLFKAEMERRAEAGELATTLAAEARYLSKWLEVHHPDMPQAKPDAVRASMRAKFWKLKGKN